MGNGRGRPGLVVPVVTEIDRLRGEIGRLGATGGSLRAESVAYHGKLAAINAAYSRIVAR